MDTAEADILYAEHYDGGTKNIELLTRDTARSFEQFAKDFAHIFAGEKVVVQ